MQPLKGLTVVTLEHAIAAPFATRQLADLGARVIKIDARVLAISPEAMTSASTDSRRTLSGPTAPRKA